MKKMFLLVFLATAFLCQSLQLISTPVPQVTYGTQTALVPISTITFTPSITSTPIPTLISEDPMISPVDSMVMVFVPGGEFIMGGIFANEGPIHKVTLDSYWIDQTEVTNAMYAKCEDAGICQPPSNTSSSTHASYYGNPEFDNYPVIHVNWHNANAYCKWAERRLPTEAEWEKSARGTKAREYPWGDKDPTIALLNFKGDDTTQVGKYPNGASPYGAYDMAGNVWEWVADWFEYGYYGSPSFNPPGPATGNSRGLRGGAWNSDDSFVRTASRYSYPPFQSRNYVGFRCASSLPPVQYYLTQFDGYPIRAYSEFH